MSYRRGNLLAGSQEAIADYVLKELEAIERGFNLQDFVKLKERHSAPERLQTGMVVLADGTDWNPGSGAGFYGYYGGSWNKLG